MERLTRIGAALADPIALRLLLVCGESELCACQLAALAKLTPPTLARHLGLLTAAGLLEARHEGRWLYYRRPDAPGSAVQRVLELVDELGREDEDARSDRDRLGAILEETPIELCRMS